MDKDTAKQIFQETVPKNLDLDFEIIEVDRVPESIDCVWEDNEKEQRIRVELEENSRPSVTFSRDYEDERSSFGIMVLPRTFQFETESEFVEKAIIKLLESKKEFN